MSEKKSEDRGQMTELEIGFFGYVQGRLLLTTTEVTHLCNALVRQGRDVSEIMLPCPAGTVCGETIKVTVTRIPRETPDIAARFQTLEEIVPNLGTGALPAFSQIERTAEGVVDQEQARWQQAIYSLLVKLTGDDSINGGGCDSGDPLDFSLTEISQAFNRTPRWTLVADGLPDDDIEVLVASETGSGILFAHHEDGLWLSEIGTVVQGVTHWMDVVPPSQISNGGAAI